MARSAARSRRTFGEISKLPSGRYRARHTGPDLQRHSAPNTFVARIDAQGWLVNQERAISRGDWLPPTPPIPEAARLLELVGAHAEVALGRRTLRPATIALYSKLLRLAILPSLGERRLRDVTVGEMTAWYVGMRDTPTQQANAYGLLKSIFMDAVEGGLVDTNPCRVRAGAQKTPAHEIDRLSKRPSDRRRSLRTSHARRHAVIAPGQFSGADSHVAVAPRLGEGVREAVEGEAGTVAGGVPLDPPK